MEKKEYNSNPQESRGWEIVRQLNEGLRVEKYANVPAMGSLEARKLLAEYIGLTVRKPSSLHSAILSCAVKMAIAFPDFHFVPFLDLWGLENLRQEDSEAMIDKDGRRFPSLVEKLTKAYAYSLLFHPDEHLIPELEEMMKPVLKGKGYVMRESNGVMMLTTPAIATHVFVAEVRNRKMTFVQMMLPDGEEIVMEVHLVTAYSKMRYDDIMNRMFDVILRTTDAGKLRAEAVIEKRENAEGFPMKVGYVEHVDVNHKHIHVYDNESRHFVMKFLQTGIMEGQYVEFVPVIPKVGNFKTAVIRRVVENGAEAFGYRKAVVTFVNDEQGYCAWDLLPEADGTIVPIMETGAKGDVEPATKGYISKQLMEKKGAMLKKGDRIEIVAFLKRGKDKKKRAFVVDYKVGE